MARESCHNCVYACWDLGQAMQGFSSGFASRPLCANHCNAPGRMRPTPVGAICRNHRRRLAAPEGDVKLIPLAGGSYAYVDAADYEWLSKYTWHVYGGGYAARYEKGKTVYMHRVIMNPPPGMVVDHIDGNKANDCRFNLRVCTRAENQRNCFKHRNSSSRFKGVGYDRKNKKYWARFRCNGEVLWLGYHEEEVEAARAYDYKAVECDGPFARVNLPEEWPPERIRQVHADAQARRAERKDGKRRTEDARQRTARKEKANGGHRTEDGRQRTVGEKKVRRSEGKEVKRTRRTRDALHTTKQGNATRAKGKPSKRKTRDAARATGRAGTQRRKNGDGRKKRKEREKKSTRAEARRRRDINRQSSIVNHP